MHHLFKLENLILLVIFLIPAYLVKLSVFGLPSNLEETLILLLIIYRIPSLSWNRVMSIYSRSRGIFFSLVLVLAGISISTLFGNNLLRELGILKSWFIVPIFFAFIISDFAISLERAEREKFSKNIIKALYFSAFTVAAASLILVALNKGITYDFRLRGFYNSPNFLGMYLASALIIGSYFLIWSKTRTGRLFYLASLALILLVFYLTHSYGNWLAVLISILIGAAIRFNKKTLLILLGAVFVVFSFFVFQADNSKLSDLVSADERSSLASRIMVWKSAGKILEDNWVFGIGPGNFGEKYLEYQKHFPPYLEWAVPQPHNLYLAFWLQTGILGLIGFLSLLYFWLKKAIKKALGGNPEALAVVSIMLYILLYGFIDTYYWKNDLAIVFWLVVALGLLLYNYPIKHPVNSVREKEELFVGGQE